MRTILRRATWIEVAELCDGDFRRYGLARQWVDHFVIKGGRVYRVNYVPEGSDR